VVIHDEDSVQRSGTKARLGEMCHRTGLLRILQKARTWLRPDLRILAYHRVLNVRDPDAFDFDLDLVSSSAEGFREQMLLVKRHFQPIGLAEAIAMLDAGKRLPANAVAVSFDDGYDDNYLIACPILRELEIPATFFVSTGHIDSGQPFAYDWLVHMILVTEVPRLLLPELGIDQPVPVSRRARRDLASHVLSLMKNTEVANQSAMIARLALEWQMPRQVGHPDCRPMTWDQLREMQAAGFEIGSHGVHHHMLAKLPQPQLEAELSESKAAIEREIGAQARLISYPVGGDRAFDERVMAATRNAGYLAACSYICGTNPQAVPNRYALYRLPVERVMGIGWFDAMLTLPELMGYRTVNRVGSAGRDTACSF
jgi:peptidoglycan/xylan/chitin deacetylase (PgdA/CDA1 family)